jgi:ABC-2 type transport system permease protein
MNKIWLVTQRELFTRIRKTSFIVMSILGPLLIAGFFGLMFYFASSPGDTEVRKIAVLDSTGAFVNRIPNTKYLKFEYLPISNAEPLKRILKQTDYYGIVYISPFIATNPTGVLFYSYHQPGLGVLQHISNAIENELRNQKLLAYKIENIDKILHSVESRVDIQTIKLTDAGGEKKTYTELNMGLAYVSSFLIYMFIMLFGVQVMRGVIEEKTNRIVEVIISSVKPFQLMMGKVLGVALAALIQFAIWIVLSAILITFIKMAFLPDLSPVAVANTQPQDLMQASHVTAIHIHQHAPAVNPDVANVMKMLDSINFYLMIGAFLFYFIGGYLLYSSLFAAVGAAVDNESDTQQFVLPITLPLIVAIMVMISAFQNPDSSLAFWFSMIPFTSPVVMMARISYAVPTYQVITSMLLLVITTIVCVWGAGKIYRTGILMYGKKVSFKELLKWLTYKS